MAYAANLLFIASILCRQSSEVAFQKFPYMGNCPYMGTSR